MDTEEAEENEKDVDINGGSEILTTDPTSPVSTTVTVPKLSPGGGGVTPPIVSAEGTSPNNLVEAAVEEKVQSKPPVETPLTSSQQSGGGDEDRTSAVKTPTAVAAPPPEEEQPPNNTSNSGPKTYANLFKSTTSSNKPNKLPPEFKPSVAPNKSIGSNGPSGSSPGNAQVVSFLQKQSTY